MPGPLVAGLVQVHPELLVVWGTDFWLLFGLASSTPLARSKCYFSIAICSSASYVRASCFHWVGLLLAGATVQT